MKEENEYYCPQCRRNNRDSFVTIVNNRQIHCFECNSDFDPDIFDYEKYLMKEK